MSENETTETNESDETTEAPEPQAEPTTEPDTAAEAPEPTTEADTAAEEPQPEPEAEPDTAAEAPEPQPEAEPDTAAEATATPAAEEAGSTTPSQQAKRSRSRRHVPRSERRQRPRKIRANTAGERSTLTRLPKPEHERGRRQERRGVVVSDAMDKTIVVRVDAVKAHPRYKKVVRRSVKFHAHDAENQAKVGDLVRIVETRPLSKTKNWRLAEVLEAAK